MEQTKKNYDIIDLIKFIASVCIFTMHSNVFVGVNPNLHFYGVQLLSRWAVPFFFTISAYFLFSKSQQEPLTKGQIWQYVKRLLILYLAWFIVNIPYIAYKLYCKDITNISTWLVFFGKAIISSTFMGSWYLLSSAFSAVFVWVLSKKLSNKYIFLIALLTYLYCIISSTYNNALNVKLGSISCNTIIAGCVFYSLGKIIADYKEKFLAIKSVWLILGSIGFFALYYLEMLILKECGVSASTDTSVFLIPFAFCFIALLLKQNVTIKANLSLRKASTIIYCSQGLIIVASKIIAKYLFKINHTCFVFLLCFILMLLTNIIILLLGKNKNSVVKYLT